MCSISDREGIQQALEPAQRHLDGFDALGDPPADLVARGRVHGGQHAAGSAPGGVNAFAAYQLDDALPELAQADAAAREIQVVFDQAEEIALLGRGVHAQQQVGRREVEKAQRVGLQQLRVVHQPALQHGRARHFHSQQRVAGLATGQHVAHRADAADSRHQAGHLMERASLAEFLEAAELGHVKLRRPHLARIVQIDGDLGVPFNSGHGMNHDALGHLSKPPIENRRAAFQQGHHEFVNQHPPKAGSREGNDPL